MSFVHGWVRLRAGNALTLAFVLTAFALAASQPSFAATDLKRGEALLTRDCSRCHAVGATGNSPRPDAPAFRSLGTRYPIDSLEEALGEGIMSGHADMPEFKFDADEVGDIIDYLKAIQKP